MSYSTRFRRPKQSAVAPLAEEPPADEPPAAVLALVALTPWGTVRVAIVAFRVGEFEVGEGFCPLLYGHPGIRY